jgi:integrase
MNSGDRLSVTTRTHLEYMPAKLTEGKAWYISFWAWDPLTDSSKRKRIKINRIDSIKERRKFATQMIRRINRDLENGWSPWAEKLAPKGLHLLIKALDIYLERKIKELDGINSVRTYKSQVKLLVEWMEKTDRSAMFAVNFKKRDAQAYLDHLIDSNKVAPTTFNNRLTVCKAMFNWLVEREYIAINPFQTVRRLQEKEKVRQVIPEHKRREIAEHLEKNDRFFLLCCYLMFYTEIRPSEQTKLKVSDCDLNRGVIVIPGTATKNKRVRIATIPKPFLVFLRTFNWDHFDPDHYIFGRGWEPGKVPIAPRLISSKWANMRDKVSLPMKYQFYSLRDSGIVWMLQQGVSPEEVMKQAGHSDLQMTTKYINHTVKGAVSSIQDLTKGF